MDLLFVGTAAADVETALKCDCPHCSAIRRLGGRNLRHYASLLVDGRLLLDCGPTVPWRLAELDVPPAQVEALVITHSHEDHLDLRAVGDLLQARPADRGPLPVYGNSGAVGMLAPLDGRLDLHEVTPGREVEVLGRPCVPVPANHNVPGEETLNWLIGAPGGWLLYATDTGWPRPETWDLLAARKLVGAVIEATFGLCGESDLPPGYLTQHLNWPNFLRLREELIGRGLLPADAPCLATHVSLHHAPIHDELSQHAAPPVVLAYDGLRVRI
ncbi:MAG: MBL fold metallo-hydrolase [Armatimonadetes bacterium]|nr:MBL fold metallo-hydrolase [Armatimonadota bacterium]